MLREGGGQGDTTASDPLEGGTSCRPARDSSIGALSFWPEEGDWVDDRPRSS